MNWESLLNNLVLVQKQILEIGTHEGLAAIWLLENKLNRGDSLHVVDVWKTSKGEKSPHETLFDYNIALAAKVHPGIAIYKHKGRSDIVLPKLVSSLGPGHFDLIYVDGSHEAADVLSDLVHAFALCKPGGLIICDDYLWHMGDNPLLTPKIAIDAFVTCFGRRLSVIENKPLYQVFLSKNFI
jgi:Methyltransferase domain